MRAPSRRCIPRPSSAGQMVSECILQATVQQRHLLTSSSPPPTLEERPLLLPSSSSLVSSLLLRDGNNNITSNNNMHSSAMKAPLVEPLSRRRARQLEQQYGPMWRYVSLQCSAAMSAHPTRGSDGEVGLASSPPGSSYHNNNGSSSIREQALEVGLMDPLGGSSRSWDTAGTQTGINNSSSSHSSAAHHNGGQDPLLAFLEKNEDDAAVLLAMWTSLRRSCLYASEISESLSLRVRYFFHSLIERRAIAAAVELYERLVYLGVHLRHSDVMLLLTHLPYEHSATNQRKRDEWVEEEQHAEKTRRARLQRQREEEEAARKRSSRAVEQQQHAAGGSASEAETTAEADVMFNKMLGDEKGTHTASAAMEPHAMANQPEWVKKWILYEASMGNVDLYGEEEVSAATTVSSDALVDDGQPLPLDTSSQASSAESASNMMALTALLHHLHLLQVTAPKRHGWVEEASASRRASSALRVRRTQDSSSSTSSGTRYGMEAHRLVKHFVNTAKEQREDDVATAKKPMGRTLSTEALAVIHSIVRESNEWTVSFAFANLLVSTADDGCSGELAPADVVLFFQLAAEDQPWKTRAAVRDFVSEWMIPLVPRETAAGYAIQCIWLSHLCSLKSSRPETFISLLHQAEVHFALGGDGLGSADSGLAAIIQQICTRAKLAASQLVVDVQRRGQQQKAQAVLAASIRSGAYDVNREEAQSSPARATGNVPQVYASAMGPAGGGALLAKTDLDAFTLCAEACMEALRVAIVGASPQAESLAAVHDLIESTVYGPFSLWSAFSRVYLNNEFHGASAVSRAPERGDVAATVAVLLLRVINEVCLFADETAVSPKQVRLMLELCVTAIKIIPQEEAVPGEGYAPAFVKKMGVVQSALRDVVRPLLSLHRLSKPCDRVLFGAVSEDAVQSLVLLAQLLVMVEGHAHHHSKVTQKVSNKQRAVMVKTLTPKTQQILKICFGADRALGKRVRSRLSRKEADKLNDMMGITGRRSASPQHITVSHSQDRIHELITLRSKMYDTLLRRGWDADPGFADKELRALVAQSDWQNSLSVFQLLTRDFVAASRHNVSTAFFADTLDGMCRGLPSSGGGGGGVPQQHHSHSSLRTRGATWLDAISVFWSAVDHAGSGESLSKNPKKKRQLDSTQSPPQGASNQAHHSGELQVLDELLLPLLRCSMAMSRRDLGQQWRKVWAKKYTAEERRSPAWKQRNILALTALKDPAALERCNDLAQSLSDDGGDGGGGGDANHDAVRTLLCTVAVRHKDWETALSTLFEHYGSMDSHKRGQTHYPLPVAHAILDILARPKTNLSNTALQLRTLQAHAWDVRCASGVMLLLLRARRWKLALQVLDDTLHLPSVRQGVSSLRGGNQGEEGNATIVEYAQLLVYGLQACAIGGESAKAGELYDQLQEVVQRFSMDGSSEEEEAVKSKAKEPCPSESGQFSSSNNNTADAVLGALDIMFEKTSSSVSATVNDDKTAEQPSTPEEERLRELSLLGRSFFFRAMTKKMMASPQN